MVCGIATKSQSMKCATLLYKAGEATVQVYNSFEWSEEADRKNYGQVKQKFQEFRESKKNLTIGKPEIFTRSQKPGESTAQYVAGSKNKSSICEFGTLNDGFVKDRIGCEILNESLRI